jgi:hypothetical protein
MKTISDEKRQEIWEKIVDLTEEKSTTGEVFFEIKNQKWNESEKIFAGMCFASLQTYYQIAKNCDEEHTEYIYNKFLGSEGKMSTIRIKKYLAEQIKAKYQDESYNTIFDTILMEIAIAKRYKPEFVHSEPKTYVPVGEDLNIRVQTSLVEEMQKEFPELTINEIIFTLLTSEEEEFRGMYPEQYRKLCKDFPGKSIYEAGLILRNSARF